MSKEKLYIEMDSLMNLINELKSNNDEVVSKIKDINKKFISIDTTKWNSPERRKYDDVFLPYIKSTEQSINDNLNNCVNNLTKARNNYLQLENSTKNK